jgi:hypothetical protein
MDMAGIAGFFMSMVMGAIVLTWLYNSTKGSLLIVAIFHAMIELMFMSSNITVKISSYLGAAIMIAAIFIILIAKPANLSFKLPGSFIIIFNGNESRKEMLPTTHSL